MSWKEICIGDIGEVITGNTPPKKNPEYYGDAYKFIKPTDMEIGQRYTPITEECYSFEGYKKYQKSLIPPLSTCVVTIGSIGKKITMTEEPSFVNQAVNAVIPNQTKYDPHFVFYALKNILPKVKNADTGASSGRENVSKSNFCSLTLEVPEDLDTQRKIGKKLGSLDDLIENNLKRIKLLEEAAQNIYKEWFVNFRFPGWKNAKFNKESGLPEEWRKEIIRNLLVYTIGGGWGKEQNETDYNHEAYVIRGTDMPDIKIGNINNVPCRFHKQNNFRSRKIIPNDIVFEVSGGSAKYPVGRSILITKEIIDYFQDKNIMCASFCKLIRCDNYLISPYYFSSTLNQNYINGSIAQYENRSASNIVNFKYELFLDKENITIPEKSVMKQFEEIIKPIFQQIGKIGNQNQKLKEARDILLPRLMNRTIEV